MADTTPGSTMTSVSIDTASKLYHFRVPSSAFDDWARVFVYTCPKGVEVVIRTDYGTYDYAWWNIGNRDGFAFLSEIDTSYAMSKFRPLMDKRNRGYPHFVKFRDHIWPRVQQAIKDIIAKGLSVPAA